MEPVFSLSEKLECAKSRAVARRNAECPPAAQRGMNRELFNGMLMAASLVAAFFFLSTPRDLPIPAPVALWASLDRSGNLFVADVERAHLQTHSRRISEHIASGSQPLTWLLTPRQSLVAGPDTIFKFAPNGTKSTLRVGAHAVPLSGTEPSFSTEQTV